MDYAEQLERINSEIKALKEKKRVLKQEWLQKSCPVNIGNKIVIDAAVHHGKTILVERLVLTEDSWLSNGKTQWGWKASGPILKKDGTPGLNYGETWQEMPTE